LLAEIVGLPGLPCNATHAGDVDDPPPTRPRHHP
jgi:hypothetical protein